MDTRQTHIGALSLLALLALCACAPETPEDRVRTLMERAERAAERRDAPAIYALLCEEFTDLYGRPAEDTLHRMTTYLLLHRPVFVLTRPVQIQHQPLGDSQATLYVALAGEPIENAADLERVPADILHLEVDVANDRDRKLCVRHAVWRPAAARDMLKAGRFVER